MTITVKQAVVLNLLEMAMKGEHLALREFRDRLNSDFRLSHNLKKNELRSSILEEVPAITHWEMDRRLPYLTSTLLETASNPDDNAYQVSVSQLWRMLSVKDLTARAILQRKTTLLQVKTHAFWRVDNEVSREILLYLIEYAMQRKLVFPLDLLVRLDERLPDLERPTEGSAVSASLATWLSDVQAWCLGKGLPNPTVLIGKYSQTKKLLPLDGYWKALGLTGKLQLNEIQRVQLTDEEREEVFGFWSL